MSLDSKIFAVQKFKTISLPPLSDVNWFRSVGSKISCLESQPRVICLSSVFLRSRWQILLPTVFLEKQAQPSTKEIWCIFPRGVHPGDFYIPTPDSLRRAPARKASSGGLSIVSTSCSALSLRSSAILLSSSIFSSLA